jgi:hypothetical protein
VRYQCDGYPPFYADVRLGGIQMVWEKIHTIHDWYDGPRSGAAEHLGATYWYRSVYLDTEEWDEDEDRFELTPMTSEILGWDLERAAIFLRWNAAVRTGSIIWKDGDNDSFGAFPEDMARFRELNERVEKYLAQASPSLLVRGTFDLKSKRVQWESLGPLPKTQ